jgi:HD-like signal output (HDOD) protein
MTDSSLHNKGKLADIFARINMSELPAMSVHVQELLALTGSKKSKSANYDDLARIILKDFSLTHKVLQIANSAYYALGQKVSTVSMAVAVLGFDTVRDLAIGIALLDDFMKAGVNTAEISKLLARSFLAALLARSIAESRYLRVLPEEAFICGLMHDLGRIISCIYLPVMYRAIHEKTAGGMPEDEAAASVLDGLTYAGVGREVAIFWNMTESVIKCMELDPALPEEGQDAEKYLHGIVDFSNRYVDCLLLQHNIAPLMDKYAFPFSLDEQEAAEMLAEAARASAAIFDSIQPGLPNLDFCKRLEEIQALYAAEPPVAVPAKGIKDFWQEINGMVKGDFRLNDFFVLLLDALWQGIGFDRALFAMVQNRGDGKVLAGQLGRGDISPGQVKQFELFLSPALPDVLQKSLSMGRDIALAPEKIAVLPEELRYLAQERTVYLFPLCLKGKGVALLYLDRTKEKPKLAKAEVEDVRKLRDFAAMTIEMKRKGTLKN